jgi:hypothetical protein
MERIGEKKEKGRKKFEGRREKERTGMRRR